MSFKEKALAALEELKGDTTGIIAATIEDCEKVIRDIPEDDGWIPVTERLPKTIPSDAGTAYSEAVNVLTSGRKVLTAIWDGTDFIADAEFWEAEGEEITHWTPVLLPLPEAPKEVEVCR